MIVPINLTGETNQSRSKPLTNQVTRNFYPELQDNASAKNKFVLQSFPGYAAFASGTEALTTQGAKFDGTNDYLTRGANLTGAANSKVGTIACRINIAGSNNRYIFEFIDVTTTQRGKFQIVNSTNKLTVQMDRASSSSSAVFIESTTSYTSADGWLNILISWDCLNDTEGQLYVNDASDYNAAASSLSNFEADYSVGTEWIIGGQNGGISLWNGDIEFLYFNTAVAIDFSVEANRRLFFAADGRPVLSPTGTGSEATGTAPIIYLAGDYSTWHTNKGTGGGFTVNGALAAADSYTFPGTASRGEFEHKGVLYQVAGTTLYSVSSAGVKTSLGAITGSAQCIFAGMGDSVLITSEGNFYVWDGATLTTVSDPDLESPNSVSVLNNQAILDGDDGRFVVGAVGDPEDIPALNYATAESNADDLARTYVIPGTSLAYLMGSKIIEQWWNSGTGTPPFDRVEGGTIPLGLSAVYSVADNGETMFFLSGKSIYAVSGSSYKAISTISLSNAISGYATTSDAIGTCYSFQGQDFYQITFPTEDKTWVYHEQVGQWFEVSSGANGGRAIFNRAVECYDKVLVGDHASSAIYELDVDTFTENGDAIYRVRDTGEIHGGLFGKPGVWLEMNRLELICETGVGDLTTTPNVIMSYSDDGGRTWSTESFGTINIGTAGQYLKKIEWFSLGGFYSRIFRFRTSEAVRYTFYEAAADIEVGI
jgi:hypothetical protein